MPFFCSHSLATSSGSRFFRSVSTFQAIRSSVVIWELRSLRSALEPVAVGVHDGVDGDRSDVLRRVDALVVGEDLEALLLDLRRRGVPLHCVDLVGAQRLTQQGTELDRLRVPERDLVDLGVALEALGAVRLEALRPGAEHVVEGADVGDLGGGRVAADDEGVAVDRRRVVEDGGADGRVRRPDHGDDRRRVGRGRRVGHQRGCRSADVVDDQVHVAVLEGVDGLGALKPAGVRMSTL